MDMIRVSISYVRYSEWKWYGEWRCMVLATSVHALLYGWCCFRMTGSLLKRLQAIRKSQSETTDPSFRISSQTLALMPYPL